MKSNNKKFSGTDRSVNVVRTAPMLMEKQKNFVELLPRPLLPQISIMWAFLESYLKKTADVFRIFPETRTILEQRIADIKDSFKLQAEGKAVDAEMVGSHYILVNYLVRCSMVEQTMKQERKDELLFILHRVRAQIADAHGTTPAVIAVDKTDRYVVDLMFMLAESVNKAVSDMSTKSWMECNITLIAVLNVYRNQLNKLLERFHIFINTGELGGSTTPSFHAHAMSERRIEGLIEIPEESADDTILTKKHFERLGPRFLNGMYIRENLDEIAVENFSLLSDTIMEKRFSVLLEDEEDNIKVDGNTLIVNRFEEEYRFEQFLERIKKIRSKITGRSFYHFNQFLKDISEGKGEDNLIELFNRYKLCFDETDKINGLAPRKRVEDFYRYMRNLKVKRRYWQTYSNRVLVSPVSEIFAASIMRKMKEKGIAERIISSIKEKVPEGLRISFRLTDYFSFSEGSNTIPAFSFTADPWVWSLYGKPIMEIAESSLNTHWEKIYYITEAFLSARSNERMRDDLLQKLDDLLGLTEVLNEMAISGNIFESVPSSFLYACGNNGSKNISETAKNYMLYFAECFAFARENRILHLPGLCPRATIIRQEKKKGSFKEVVEISPIVVYTPVMTSEQFERRLGPITLLKEANARFELIGNGKEGIVVQKTGGECRTKGRHVFHRDKREILRSRPRIDEEPLVAAITETIKKYVFTEENLGNPQELYFQHYMRGYIEIEYKENKDVSWKKIAEILLHADKSIYTVDSNKTKVNIDSILNDAFANSQYAEIEIGKAISLIRIIKEARDDAIRRMDLVEKRSSKLMKQIEEGRFLATNEILMKTLKKCISDQNFLSLLNVLNLPKDEKIQEHIFYIFGVRQIERQERLLSDSTGRVRTDLIRDNLDTISFFKLAEIIVIESFKKMRGTRLQRHADNPEELEQHLRDIINSEYLLVEFIARSIYKFVSESPKLREGYQELIKGYQKDDPFFKRLKERISEDLRNKSFQTEEIWRARGANDEEGYIELIEKSLLPSDKVSKCVINIETHGDAMDKLMNILRNNLESVEYDI